MQIMKLTRRIIPLTLLAVAAVASSSVAQTSGDRRGMERRLDELREEMRDIERQLGGAGGGFFRVSGPRIVEFSSNQAQLGVIVRTEESDETDRIGAFIEEVNPDGAAAKAGLMAGDVVTAFDGESLMGRYPPANADESALAIKLVDLVHELEPGDEVSITYVRDGQEHSATVTLGGGNTWGEPNIFFSPFGGAPSAPFAQRREVRLRVDESGDDITAIISMVGDMWSDIELVALNEDLGRYFGADEGLLVINPPSEEGVDLRGGDVILSIDGRDARSPGRALRILRSYEPGETVNLEVLRDRDRTTVSIEIPQAGEWDGHGILRRRFF